MSNNNLFNHVNYDESTTQNNQNAREVHYTTLDAATGTRIFLNRVYNWMFGGLAITALTAWAVLQNEKVFMTLAQNFMIFIIAELGLVLWLSIGIQKMAATTSGVLFFGYAILNGVTLSPICYAYTQSSVAIAFGSCALMFGGMSVFGYATKQDLSKIGSMAIMALWGIIIASLLNFFFKSEKLTYVLSYVGIAVFVGLTAYDTQRIKQLADAYGEDAESETMKKSAVIGALTLYLDFINMFLYLLRIFGKRR